MTSLCWYLPENLLQQSVTIMRPHGLVGNEGLALWYGNADGRRVNITHVVSVSGPGFHTTPLYMRLSLRAMSTLTALGEQLNSFLVGQIHSHPERFLDLSKLDKEMGIRSPDYLSVVCPYYAQRDISGFDECGVHVFDNRIYRRMPAGEVSRRLILSNTRLKIIRCEVPA